MKYTVAVIGLVLCLQSQAQQKAFLEVDSVRVMAFSLQLYDIFDAPHMYDTYTCYPEYLDSAAKYDFSQLKNLEVLHVQFSLDPETDDKQKALFIDTLLQRLENIKYFKKAPKLKKIIIGTGEQIFLSKKEVENFNWDYEKMGAANLQKAWDKMGNKIKKLVPGVKVYGYTWNW